MPVATFPLGPLQTNSYLMHNDSDAVAIDVGGEPGQILEYLAENKLKLAAIVLSHMHFDHLYGVAALAGKTGAPVLASPADDCLAEHESCKGGIWGFPLVQAFSHQPVEPGKTVLAGMNCEVLATPGHTPGGISLYFPDSKVVFTGDALFYRSMGRTDFFMGDQASLLHSIRKVLFALPEETTVYPGHGPSTTIGDERRQNPFCGDFA